VAPVFDATFVILRKALVDVSAIEVLSLAAVVAAPLALALIWERLKADQCLREMQAAPRAQEIRRLRVRLDACHRRSRTQ
jgi:hypothetical protein